MSDTAATGAPEDGEAPSARRVLVIAAHPDDIDFGAGGTVAALTAAGVAVSYLVVTDGDAGGFDEDVERSAISEIRRGEQRRAGAVLGVVEITFLGYPDGRLSPSVELRRDISRVIRRVRPDRVLCPSPERDLARLPASHPDHLATGEAALCAVYPDARNPFAYPELLAEGLEPHVVKEIWLMAHPSANVFVDVSETIEQKLAALGAHESQLPDPASTMAMVRAWAERTGMQAGYLPGRLAEGFFETTVW